jgi:dihydroorotate dehydrogenase (NAD+) catalytic subunit
MDMRVDLGGLVLKNPVMAASGTFGYGLEFADYGDLSTLGGFVVKGLSLEPRQGNPGPRITETACGMLNAIGIQNMGVRAFLAEKLPLLPHERTAVMANLYATSVEEFGELAAALSEARGVAALEVNVSCPNVSCGGAAFGADPAMVERVTRSVRDNAREIPVMVKLSPNVADVAAAARAAEAGGAHMISAVNTLVGMAVDIRTRRPELANVVGGLSGPAIKPVALRCVYQAARAVDIPVIGVGGVTCAADVLEFLLVGAHAVQVGTANFIRPDTCFSLVREVEALARELGLSSFDEYRGTLET